MIRAVRHVVHEDAAPKEAYELFRDLAPSPSSRCRDDDEAGRRVLRDAPHLSVGIATADPLHLADAPATLASAGVRMVHLDVMDGVFCPLSTTASPALARAIAPDFMVDVHLMVDDPLTGARVDRRRRRNGHLSVGGRRHPHRVLQSMAVETSYAEWR